MPKALSNGLFEEMIQYFKDMRYRSKNDLIWSTRHQIEEFLEDCEFVYITDNGNVIHSKRLCGNAYGEPVHIYHAIKHGYTKLCTKCALGSHTENLLIKYKK